MLVIALRIMENYVVAAKFENILQQPHDFLVELHLK
jgi:hypothetical protein